MSTKLETVLVVILLATTMITSCLFINSKQISFTDEVLFEEISFRMAASGNFLNPVLGNNVWLQKPPLYFWLTAPMFYVANWFTPNVNIFNLNQSTDQNHIFNYPWIRRFWTEIAALICVYFTYLITKLIDNRKSALVAGLVLLTTPDFFFSLLSASLDVSYAALLTISIYLYLKLINKPHSPSNKLVIFLGVTLGLCILMRSILAFTPFAIIALHQLFTPKKRLDLSTYWKTLLACAVIFLPWHFYELIKNTHEFISVYLGFNLINHAVYLTQGYAATTPLYYLRFIIQNPWFYLTLPFWLLLLLKATNLALRKFKKNQIAIPAIIKSVGNLPASDNLIIILWIIVPTLVLTPAATRHSWYLIQIIPAVAILAGQVIFRLNANFQKLKNETAKYLLYLTFLTFVIVPYVVLFAKPNHNARLVEILGYASTKLPENDPLYAIPLPYFPHTLLYLPHQIQTITIDNLKNASKNSNPFYIFIGKEDIPKALQILPNLKLVYDYHEVGNLYTLPHQ